MTEMPSQRDFTEDLADREIHDAVFRGLHTLSMGYRNLMVDYYIGELPVKELCRKYQLPATTVKWRLNVGRPESEGKNGRISRKTDLPTHQLEYAGL